MSETRYPMQERSILKRQKIIDAGFYLMCENGYYKTTTADIAHEAGVSTGIVYQYFKDKKEIFLEGVRNYSSCILHPMIDILENEMSKNERFDVIIEKIIDQFINTHNISKKAHEELMAMSYLDEDISNIFKDDEMNLTLKIVELFHKHLHNYHVTIEKVHLIYGLIDHYCHEVIYHKHPEINYIKMKQEVIKGILFILEA